MIIQKYKDESGDGVVWPGLYYEMVFNSSRSVDQTTHRRQHTNTQLSEMKIFSAKIRLSLQVSFVFLLAGLLLFSFKNKIFDTILISVGYFQHLYKTFYWKEAPNSQ